MFFYRGDVVSFLSWYLLWKNVNFDMIGLFSFVWTEVESSESVSLAIATWSCQSVSSELRFRSLMSIWFCIRFLAMLHLSSGWGKLICRKMMQHRRCCLIKEPTIWRNIWAPNSWFSISGAKLIQNKVLWHTSFLYY